jgi:protease I
MGGRVYVVLRPPDARVGDRKPIEGVQMTDQKLQGKKVAILAAEMFEEVELVEPKQALEGAGATTELISLEPGEVQAFNHYDKAGSFKVDRTVEEASADDYDALLLPGGVGNPDNLRQDENAVEFVRSFFEQGKPVAAICHAPWTLVEAGVVRGRKLTSFPSLQTDIRNAGGNWVDEEVVVDAGLVTSRKPDDIPAFNEKMIEEFCEGRHAEQAQRTGTAMHAEATPS